MLFPTARHYLHNRIDTVLRSVLRHSGWSAFGQGISAAVAFAETLILARFLGVEKFGEFIVLTSAIELIFGVLDFRTREAVIRFIPELRQTHSKESVSAFMRWMFATDGTVALLGLLIIVLLGSFIVGWLDLSSDYAQYLMILSIGIALRTLVRSVGSYLRVSNSFQLSIKLGILASLFKILMIIIAVLIHPQLDAIVFALLGADVLNFLLFSSVAIRSFKAHNLSFIGLKFRFSNEQRKAIYTFLFTTNLNGTLKTLATRLDVLIISATSSHAVAAIYKIAGRIANVLLLFSDPLLTAVYPEMAQLKAQRATDQIRKLIVILTGSLAICASIILLVFVFGGERLLLAVAGNDYETAFRCVIIMLVGTSLNMVFFWARPLLLLYDLAAKVLQVAFLSFIVQFVCLFLLVNKMGAEGAGLAFTIYYVVSIVSLLYLLRENAILRLNNT